jgi:acetyl esterase/lipase
MKNLALISLVAVMCWMVCASESLAQEVTSQPMPGVLELQNVQYVPGNDPAQRLDLFLPAQAGGKPLPLVIYIHGGGWSAGDLEAGPNIALVGQGYAAASLQYRFSQQALFPAQIQDCQAAIRWLRANSKKYNIDPAHFGVWGASAGGHLAALLGTAGGKNVFPSIGGNENQSDRVQAVCDEFGPADFTTVMSQASADKHKNMFDFNHGDPYSVLIGVPLGSDKARTDAVSPVHYVSRDNPPFLILHGTADTLVPYAQSVELYDALKNARVYALLQTFRDAGHGGPIFDSPAANALIKAFFDKHLRGQKVKVDLLPESEAGFPEPPTSQ